jgi:hypothetical protein
MAGERAWVEAVKQRISSYLPKLVVETSHRLPYALYISHYHNQAEPAMAEPSMYQTDLLIAERRHRSTDWVPRVVVEFKLGTITTHDALTYSAKAATHKSIHPYFRYGIVIGQHAGPVPRRLIRHGQQFDFMLTLGSKLLSPGDRDRLCILLRQEVRASQEIERLLSGKSGMKLVHRKLAVSK